MATTTFRTAVGDTTGTPDSATYPAAPFTPTVGDLIVSICLASGSLISAGGAFTLVDNRAGGSSYARVGSVVKGVAQADQMAAFVRNNLTTVNNTHTCTLSTAGDNSTGALVAVWTVAGMSKVGAAAVRQVKTNTGVGGTAPTVTFDSAVLTGNVVLYMVASATNPANVGVVTAGFPAEDFDTGYITPTTGCEGGHRDSGFTGSTLTWSSSASAWGVIAIELDTSPSGISTTLDRATEADTALNPSTAKGAAIAAASDTDTAAPLASTKAAGLAAASDADAALPLSTAKAVTLEVAHETDTAWPITTQTAGSVEVELDQATEADTARPITAAKAVTLEVAVETSEAEPVDINRAVDLDLAADLDAALDLILGKQLDLDAAAETDEAHPLAAFGLVPTIRRPGSRTPRNPYASSEVGGNGYRSRDNSNRYGSETP